MKIDKIIDQWFKETDQQLESKIESYLSSDDKITKLCVCVYATYKQYCSAIIQLLNSNYEYPAKALLRCLGELNAKFTWILKGCQDNKGTSSESIKKRIERWEKSACSKMIQLLEDSEVIIRPEDRKKHEETLSSLKQNQEEFKKTNLKNLPDLKNIFVQLGSSFYDEIRPAFYSSLNDAVHLDPMSMSAIYGSIQQGRETIESYCIAYAFNINYLIRSRYKIDNQHIKEEYYRLIKII